MTEQEWLTSNDPSKMLKWLTGDAVYSGHVGHLTRAQRDRKLRLFANACSCLSDLRNPDFGDVIEERMPAQLGQMTSIQWAEVWIVQGHHVGPDYRLSQQTKAALLRDIFGNPFRPVEKLIRHRVSLHGQRDVSVPSWLNWNDGTIRKLAEGIYDDNAFERMPILADALEEAGCDNQEMLNHCRNWQKKALKHNECPICGAECKAKAHYVTGVLRQSYSCPNRSSSSPPHSWVTPEEGKILRLPPPDPHVRGCWVIDLLLNKS